MPQPTDAPAAPSTVDSVKAKHILSRCDTLAALNERRRNDLWRVRAIVDGGTEGMKALLGRSWQDHPERELSLIPAANHMVSGLDRLAQRTGRLPDLNMEPPQHQDSDAARKRTEKVLRILSAMDEQDRLELALPQAARWLFGYGFVPFVMKGHRCHGAWYPHAELRDPWECDPAPWGPQQQPIDVAFRRIVPAEVLIRLYPEHASVIKRSSSAVVPILPSADTDSRAAARLHRGFEGGSWENPAQAGLEVVEYYDADGTWVVLPERMLVLDFSPNPEGLGRGAFVLIKKFSFNELHGIFDHTIGLMSSMAKISVLVTQAIEDAVHTEALALDTPIPTPAGWTTMGEIRGGDLILGADGLPVEVFKATEVQHDRECFRVTFQDGTSVVASDGHLWSARRGQSKVAKVFTTREMFEDSRIFRVPAPQPWKLPEVDLPIDPYIFGLWVGDGSSRAPSITASESDMPYVRDQAHAAGYDTKLVASSGNRAPTAYLSTPESRKGLRGSGLHGELRTLGVLGDKHIPAIYLRGSIDQRVELLRGLMDSDGCICKDGVCRFTNSNRQVVDSILELLRSLGEVPTERWEPDKRSRSGGYWHVGFTPRHFNPFRMPRKAERVRFHKSGKWVRIKSIDPVESVPVRCIAVANSDHLFLAGIGGHVTHNTNVIGERDEIDYQRGRGAVNFLSRETRVERPYPNVNPAVFNAVGFLERQLRVTSGYDGTLDGDSPTSFITGRGVEELRSGVDAAVREAQLAIKWGLQDLDRMRLDYDEARFDYDKPLVGYRRGDYFEERYTPSKAIRGMRHTRRVYGAMAGFDDPAKVAVGANLVQMGAMSLRTFMENIDGLENVFREEERIKSENASQLLRAGLEAAAQQGDPAALMALIEMMPEGNDKRIMQRFFTPNGDELSPEEEAILNPPPDPARPGMGLPATPPDVATVLARTFGDSAELGVQRVGRVA